jgi:uncharacterized protein with HEPN domain
MDIDIRDRQALKKILKEISFIKTAVNDFSFDDFINDEKTKRAVAMTLINIGELMRLLSDEFKKSMPDIPFKAIMTTRNVAAHGYEVLRFDDVWKTVTTSISELDDKIKKLLDASPEG